MKIRTALLAVPLVALAVVGVTVSNGATHHHHHAGKGKLARQLAQARVATAKYVDGLDQAGKDGYKVITPMMHNMGFHYLNPAITKFDVTKPMILVYTRRDGKYQLGALEWVFPKKPKKAPLPGARYGSFPAACHYEDGSFVPAASEGDCAPTHGGSAFFFWHPDLVTLHVWLWYPNPDGLYEGMNPMVKPFNHG